MLPSMDTRTAHALIRFGLGRRGAEPLPADPAAWLMRQLDGPDPFLATPGASSADGLTAFREDRKERSERKLEGAPPPGTPPPGMPPNPQPAEAMPHRVRDMVKADFGHLLDHVLTTDTPFRERLAWFWSNHFTVSARRGEVAPVMLPFMREAIRPNVTGRFVDMLFAAMRHPAMLEYLDNASSIGPASPAGLRSHRGLNENLARECLELHTLSPASGYTQADVTEFAKILTGWSIDANLNPPQFVFRLNAHEPGAKTMMGQSFPHGLAGGVEALTWIADHPWTHRHLATKLVRHFVADDPPPAAVARVEGALSATKGNLKAAYVELIRMPEAWQPLTKLRSPMDYVVAAMRALDFPPDNRPDIVGVMGQLGQPAFNAPLPNGWPDTAADWAGSEAMLRRVDWSYGMAARATAVDPDALAQNSLGALLKPATLEQMHHAGSRRDAITLVLASPEFLRR